MSKTNALSHVAWRREIWKYKRRLINPCLASYTTGNMQSTATRTFNQSKQHLNTIDELAC